MPNTPLTGARVKNLNRRLKLCQAFGFRNVDDSVAKVEKDNPGIERVFRVVFFLWSAE
jgi:hypothetical protein